MTAAALVQKRIADVRVGDVIQHPRYARRWINVEWVGYHATQPEEYGGPRYYVAGWFGVDILGYPGAPGTEQREAVSFRPNEWVAVQTEVEP